MTQHIDGVIETVKSAGDPGQKNPNVNHPPKTHAMSLGFQNEWRIHEWMSVSRKTRYPPENLQISGKLLIGEVHVLSPERFTQIIPAQHVKTGCAEFLLKPGAGLVFQNTEGFMSGNLNMKQG